MATRRTNKPARPAGGTTSKGTPRKAKKEAAPAGSFGARLKAAREAAGLTQSVLGAAVDMDKRMIARYEADQAAPSIHAAARLARAAGVSLDVLGGLAPSEHDPELGRLLAQLAELPEADRMAARRVLAGLLKLNEG